MLASLEKYCKLCSTMKSHNGSGDQEGLHRGESDPGAGTYRKNTDLQDGWGSCAKALGRKEHACKGN